jgi:hypothetical protein
MICEIPEFVNIFGGFPMKMTSLFSALLVLALTAPALAAGRREAPRETVKSKEAAKTNGSISDSDRQTFEERFQRAYEEFMKDMKISENPDKDIVKAYREAIKEIRDPSMRKTAELIEKYVTQLSKSATKEDMALIAKIMDFASSKDIGIKAESYVRLLDVLSRELYETKNISLALEGMTKKFNEQNAKEIKTGEIEEMTLEKLRRCLRG